MKTYTILMTFFVCYIPILVFSAIIPYISRKTESFGVSIPEEEYNNPEIKKIRGFYRTSVLAFGGIMTFFALFTAFFGALDSAMIFLPVGTFIQLAVMFVFYLVGHKSMQALKNLNSSWTVDRPQVVIIDTDFRKRKIMVSPLWFSLYAVVIPATLLFGFFMYDKMPDRLPMQYDFNGVVTRYADKSYKMLIFAPVMQIFMAFLMAFIYWIIGKSKQQIDPSNPERSIEQNRVFRYRWSAFTVFMGFLMLLIFAFIQVSFTGIIKDLRLITIVPTVLTIIIIIAALVLSVTTGQGGSRVKTKSGASGNSVIKDDDKYWKLGMFYYNPEDPALFVEKRFGVGWTNNFARPLSWIMLVGVAVGLPLLMLVIIKMLAG